MQAKNVGDKKKIKNSQKKYTLAGHRAAAYRSNNPMHCGRRYARRRLANLTKKS